MRWFGKQDTSKASSISPNATGYDPALIDHFKTHHQTLRQLAVTISELAEKQAFDELTPRLREFAELFEQHNTQENVRFYAVLGKQLQPGDRRQYLTGMKDEMRKIGHTVRHFLRLYLENGVDADNVAAFRDELATILSVFDERVVQEESTLFELYQAAATE